MTYDLVINCKDYFCDLLSQMSSSTWLKVTDYYDIAGVKKSLIVASREIVVLYILALASFHILYSICAVDH